MKFKITMNNHQTYYIISDKIHPNKFIQIENNQLFKLDTLTDSPDNIFITIPLTKSISIKEITNNYITFFSAVLIYNQYIHVDYLHIYDFRISMEDNIKIGIRKFKKLFTTNIEFILKSITNGYLSNIEIKFSSILLIEKYPYVKIIKHCSTNIQDTRYYEDAGFLRDSLTNALSINQIWFSCLLNHELRIPFTSNVIIYENDVYISSTKSKINYINYTKNWNFKLITNNYPSVGAVLGFNFDSIDISNIQSEFKKLNEIIYKLTPEIVNLIGVTMDRAFKNMDDLITELNIRYTWIEYNSQFDTIIESIVSKISYPGQLEPYVSDVKHILDPVHPDDMDFNTKKIIIKLIKPFTEEELKLIMIRLM